MKKPQWLLPKDDDYDPGHRDTSKGAWEALWGSKSRRPCTEQHAKSSPGSSARYKRALHASSYRAGFHRAMCRCLSFFLLRRSLASTCDSSLVLKPPVSGFSEMWGHCTLGLLPPLHPLYLFRSKQRKPSHIALLSLCHHQSTWMTRRNTTAALRPWSIDHYDAKTQASIMAGPQLSFRCLNSAGCSPALRNYPRPTYCHQHSSRALSPCQHYGHLHSPPCHVSRCAYGTGNRPDLLRLVTRSTDCGQQGWQDCYQDSVCCAVCNRP